MKGEHHLRHPFCSHLAMAGTPARIIQEVAGRQDIRTTQRYMHLSPLPSRMRCSGSIRYSHAVEKYWRRLQTLSVSN